MICQYPGVFYWFDSQFVELQGEIRYILSIARVKYREFCVTLQRKLQGALCVGLWLEISKG